MKRWMLGLGVITAAAMSSTAFAATYYLSDCQAGAAAGCVAGKSTNDGLSAATPKRLWSELPARKGGDKILFAKGGAWVNASMGVYIPTASAATPVVWDSYSPAWGGSAKPILIEARVGKDLFSFDDGGQKKPDGGYVIRNLDLRGGGVMGGAAGGTVAIFAYWQVNDLLIENVEISGFKVGVQLSHNPKAVGGWENYRVSLRNSYLHDNSSFAFLGGADGLLVENNIFDRNGSTSVFDHDVYISTASRAVVRGNTITRSVLDKSGRCSGSVVVVHGSVDGLLIESNKIIQTPGSIPQCFGIEVSGGYSDSAGPEYFHDVVIRNNTIVDVGYLGVGVRGCTGCVVENNAIVWTAGGGFAGVSMSVNNPSSLDERGTALVVRNNSIYNQSPSGVATGISLLSEGVNHTVTGNVIYFGSGATAQVRCFDTKDYKAADFKAFDNNLCFRASGAVNYSVAFPAIASAQAAGFDVHGKIADPFFVAAPSAANGYSLAVRAATSTAVIGVAPAVDRVPPAAPAGLNAR